MILNPKPPLDCMERRLRRSVRFDPLATVDAGQKPTMEKRRW
jgi:hypothetical protein